MTQKTMKNQPKNNNKKMKIYNVEKIYDNTQKLFMRILFV